MISGYPEGKGKVEGEYTGTKDMMVYESGNGLCMMNIILIGK